MQHFGKQTCLNAGYALFEGDFEDPVAVEMILVALEEPVVAAGHWRWLPDDDGDGGGVSVDVPVAERRADRCLHLHWARILHSALAAHTHFDGLPWWPSCVACVRRRPTEERWHRSKIIFQIFQLL